MRDRIAAYIAGYGRQSIGIGQHNFIHAIDAIPVGTVLFSAMAQGPYTNVERVDYLDNLRRNDGSAATKPMKKKADQLFHPNEDCSRYYRTHSMGSLDNWWRPSPATLNSEDPPLARNTNVVVERLFEDVEYRNIFVVYSTSDIAKGERLVGPEPMDGYGSGPG